MIFANKERDFGKVTETILFFKGIHAISGFTISCHQLL